MGSSVTTDVYLLDGPGLIRRHRRVPATLRSNWVRVRFLYCGICGSDISKFEGRRELTYPVSVGHEFVAEIEEVGAAVREFDVGDVVTSDLNFRCGSCDRCEVGESHLCRTGQIGHFTNRGLASRADLHESYLLRLSSNASPHLSLAEPLACVLHAKRWARLGPRDKVLVVGSGGLGMCMTYALLLENPGLTFDITDVVEARMLALAAAATPFCRPVPEPHGEYDVVFDLSGSEEGLRAASERVRLGGRLCSMSHLSGREPASFLFGSLMRRDISFKLSYLDGQRDNLATASRLLEDQWSEAWDSLLEIVPLESLTVNIGSQRAADRCKTVVTLGESD